VTLFKRLALATTLAACVAAAVAAPVTGQGTWESTLLARDINGYSVALNDSGAAFFYDSTQNITWLANMRLSTSDPNDNFMDWSSAMALADQLTTGGYTDWRLPAVVDSGAPGCQYSFGGGTDCGFNVQTLVGGVYSEWAHLYYVTLGNLAFCPPGVRTPDTCGGPQPGWGLSNTAYFRNMLFLSYWSGTEYESPGSGRTWRFDLSGGSQRDTNSTDRQSVAAVRTGDVLRIRAVPEPQGLLLVLTALIAAGVSLRQRRAAGSAGA
jgi:hypothetical protein